MGIFYNKEGDIVEIIIRDSSGRKTGTWKFSTNDKKLANRVLKDMANKYDFSPTIRPGEHIEDLKREEEQDSGFWKG